MKNNFEKIGNILGIIGLIGIACFILGFPLMLLWNWIMPILFHLPNITFWQAIGLQFISTLLFKNNHYTNK